jgi:hypothetical protein
VQKTAQLLLIILYCWYNDFRCYLDNLATNIMVKKYLKSLFKILFFRGNYEFLPTVLTFWSAVTISLYFVFALIVGILEKMPGISALDYFFWNFIGDFYILILFSPIMIIPLVFIFNINVLGIILCRWIKSHHRRHK